MNLKVNPPFYSSAPIRSLNALSRALAVPVVSLRTLADTANSRYRLAKPIVKPDGTVRQPFDALQPLKDVHRRIKTKILARVTFPPYLTGSIRGQSYRTNAALHAGAKIIICEDVEGFFPSTSAARVYDIWRYFFGCTDNIAELLTRLTTKDGALPQGAITSSYLANLTFWRDEPRLHASLAEAGIIYSRYVDDLALSSKAYLSDEEQTACIARVYGMLTRAGYRAKRRKHEVFTDKRPMLTTKLLVNKRPALMPDERAKIRTAVHQLENRFAQGERGQDIKKELARVAGRVGKLKAFHSAKGTALTARVKRIRDVLQCKS